MIDRSKSIARVQFLAGQRIEIGGQVVTPEAERLFGMIVRLSVPLGRMTSRQAMMDTLWPGADDANARHNLRQTVYKAREIGLVIESGEDGLRLDPRHWSCDWEDPVGDVPGEWLHDYEPEFSAELRSWIASQRVGVHALIRPRIIRSLQTARSSGELLLADRYAAQLLRIDELNEEATLTRAESLAMQGAKVDALKLLDSYLAEIGRLGSGKDAALPAQLLRRRIAEKLPAVSYNNGSRHHGPLVGRQREAKRLLAGLFDARAGRGSGFLVHGGDGMGKSRLLFEVRKSAILQGMLIVELSCESAPSVTPYAVLRTLVARLLACAGAFGVSPDALSVLRAWSGAGYDVALECPLAEIEDLLSAVSEETPLLVLVEHAELMDADSLSALDRVYRVGRQRHHAIVVASSMTHRERESTHAPKHLESLRLRPMSLQEVREVVDAYAHSEIPRATSDQINCAAVFAEGIPMYGIEMLGLMLDVGSPDTIPWRVQIAVERAIKGLNELQLRILKMCDLLCRSAKHSIISRALQTSSTELIDALDELETAGYVQCVGGLLRPSPLLADAAGRRIRAARVRLDARAGAESLIQEFNENLDPDDFYTCLRLLVVSEDEIRAQSILDSQTGTIIRRDTAQNIVHELSRIRGEAKTPSLTELINGIVNQVAGGAANRRESPAMRSRARKPSSLPSVSPASREIEYALSSEVALASTLSASRDPSIPPAQRLAEAVMALFIASNRNDLEGLTSAYRAVNAVRFGAGVNPFDAHRADVIYFASTGKRAKALSSAKLLAESARVVNDVELACTGLRNAAEAMSAFGDVGAAQTFLLESREIAAGLQYHAQVIRADLRLADLCLSQMDQEGARAYLTSAEEAADRHHLYSPLLIADLSLYKCWEALVRDDLAQAQRAARALDRAFQGKRHGTAQWTRLSVRLATFRGKRSRDDARDFALLKASIGSCAYYPTEQQSLTALLLYSRGSAEHSAVSEFVRDQLPRISASGRSVWPFLTRTLGQPRVDSPP